MNQKNFAVIVFVVVLVIALVIGCSENAASVASNTSRSSGEYHSGKGSAWDEQVNEIYNEYGEDIGMSAAEIDAAMRAMEQGLQER